MSLNKRYATFAKDLMKMETSRRARVLNQNYNQRLMIHQVQKFRGSGHGNTNRNPLQYVRYISIPAMTLFASLYDWEYVKTVFFPKVYAAEMSETDEKNTNQQKIKSEDQMIEDQNDIRTGSTPETIFLYFATIKVKGSSGSEVFMTPDDFLRAITPGMKHPDDLGLFKYKIFDAKNVHNTLDLELDEDSIFYKLDNKGLISFSDFIFLYTVLTTSKKCFEKAFHSIDRNGDQGISSKEFRKIAVLMKQQTSIGLRDRSLLGPRNFYKKLSSTLKTYFFGLEKKNKLTIKKLLDFQEQLQKEMLNLEFEHRNPDTNGNISETNFADLLLVYSNYSEEKKMDKLEKVKQTFENNAKGVNRDDCFKFFHFLNNIDKVHMALECHHITNIPIDHATLKHVAKTVAHADLSDHVIQIICTIFDENMDGRFNDREFVAVMKRRVLRDLHTSKQPKTKKKLFSLLCDYIFVS